MSLKLEEFYKMSLEEAISKLKLADVKIRNNGNDIVAIELKYANKDITQADDFDEVGGKKSKW